MDSILHDLFSQKDTAYADFQHKLTPTADRDYFIGVRTPVLRKLAKEIIKDGRAGAFLQELPHQYFEENQLHGFVISENKDFSGAVETVESFLPYIDNWATCDQTSPKVFKKHTTELEPYLLKWLREGQERNLPYMVRFSIGMYLQFYLDEHFQVSQAEMIAAIRFEEYYVRMEVAWYMATALAKQWEQVIPILEKRLMDPWTHRKTIQKAIESYRIAAEQKEYLRTLK